MNGYLAFTHKPTSQKPNHENSFDENANRKAETLACGDGHPRVSRPHLEASLHPDVIPEDEEQGE